MLDTCSAARRYQGLLGGLCGDYSVRVDALCVPAERAAEMAADVAQQWPARGEWLAALDLALAEGWTAWDAQ